MTPGRKSKERAVGFVVARLDSSRMPRKQLRKIGDRLLLQWIIDRLRSCKELDGVVIATVAEKENEPLRQFAHEQGIECFWYDGNPEHVTTRLRRAAEEFEADICVLVSGDCPLIDPESVDYLIKEIRAHPEAGVVIVEEKHNGDRPALQGVGVARKRSWQRADDLSESPEMKEHQFPFINRYPDLFEPYRCKLPENLYESRHHRFSVDTWADLEFMNRLYQGLIRSGKEFTLPQALAFLKKNPELLEINKHVHQRRVGEEIKKVLVIADAGLNIGYGHLMRSRELALQIIERLGWPVTFAVDDEKSEDLLNESGIRTIDKAQRPKSTVQGTRDKGNSPIFRDPHLLDAFDLVILDLHRRRDLGVRWRQGFPRNCKVVVMDHSGNWTKEADLLVIPGVTYDESIYTWKKEHPRVVGGKEYLILRREIQRLQGGHVKKDLDLLAYLYSQEEKEAVRKLAGKNGFKVHVIERFEADFPELLARSRIFLSGFGHSFYEALALGVYPITLPLTDVHGKDAQKFYHRLGLPSGVLGRGKEIENVLNDMTRQENKLKNPGLKDGTPRIVQEISSLLEIELVPIHK